MIKATRPASRPRTEWLMMLDTALEELAADALEDDDDAVEEVPEEAAAEPEAEAEAEDGEPDAGTELEPGRVALPPTLLPFGASYGYGLV